MKIETVHLNETVHSNETVQTTCIKQDGSFVQESTEQNGICLQLLVQKMFLSCNGYEVAVFAS